MLWVMSFTQTFGPSFRNDARKLSQYSRKTFNHNLELKYTQYKVKKARQNIGPEVNYELN
jgi:hypothetical protein